MLELLRNKKLKVRAGARNPEEARALVKAATEYGILTGDAARRLMVVPVDLEDEDSIAPAVGNAGKVRCLPFFFSLQVWLCDCVSGTLPTNTITLSQARAGLHISLPLLQRNDRGHSQLRTQLRRNHDATMTYNVVKTQLHILSALVHVFLHADMSQIPCGCLS